MRKRTFLIGCVIFSAALVLLSCSSTPDIVTESKPEPKPVISPQPPPSDFSLKSFQKEMSVEMRISFEIADEVIVGVYSGNHNDEQFGLIYYFDDFKSFDKTSMSWGPEKKVIVQVQANELKPEIIKKNEFNQLSDLDKVGICWDSYEQTRYIYLVEGQKMLIFLKRGYDEARNRPYRNLIDAYPVTSICCAADIFDLMIRNF